MATEEKQVFKVGVIGTGSYGTAMAYVTARSGHDVTMWSRRPAVCESINKDHINPQRFSDKVLPDNIKANSDLSAMVQDVDYIIHAITAQATYGFYESNKELFMSTRKPILCTSKGIDQERVLLMCQVLAEILGEDYPTAFLSGPSFAKEMVAGHPMAVTVASHFPDILEQYQSLFDHHFFRCYGSTDVIGVEVGGALKNPLAIGAGMARGMGYGQSTIAGIVTRGITEMQALCVKLGGNTQTLNGLSGMGDLMLTCFSSLSRNNRFGFLIGSENKSKEEAAELIGEVVEGAHTAGVVLALMEKHNLRMPLFKTVALILSGELSPQDGLESTMGRGVAGHGEFENIPKKD